MGRPRGSEAAGGRGRGRRCFGIDGLCRKTRTLDSAFARAAAAAAAAPRAIRGLAVRAIMPSRFDRDREKRETESQGPSSLKTPSSSSLSLLFLRSSEK